MLVLVIRGIYEFRWHDIRSKFMTIGSGVQVILRLLPKQFERLQCWYF
jgi:hypothetical protein